MENKTITEAAATLLELLTAQLGIKEEAQPHILEILTEELETLYNKGYMQGKLEVGELAARRHREWSIDRLEGTVRLVEQIRKEIEAPKLGSRYMIDEMLNTTEDNARREIDALK